MAKAKTVFFCTNCGNESPKWQGRCPACGAWNTYEEHIEKPTLPGKAKSSPVGQSRKPQRIQDVTTDGEIRFSTGMGELDRVLGGGAVAGSLVLVGGGVIRSKGAVPQFRTFMERLNAPVEAKPLTAEEIAGGAPKVGAAV